jgi:excisionase family DNA binding protein
MAYVSAAEAARLTGVSERTVRRWAASGQVRSVKRGHGYRVALSEVAAMVGQANGLDADSGPAMSDMTATADLSAAAAIEAGHMAALVRELQDKLVQQAATTAMWQARAETLGHQLRALQAPTNGPQSHGAANLTAEAPNLTREPPEPEPEPTPPPVPVPILPGPDGRSWWRRLWGALLSTPG